MDDARSNDIGNKRDPMTTCHDEGNLAGCRSDDTLEMDSLTIMMGSNEPFVAVSDSESFADDDRNDDEMTALGQRIQSVLNNAYRNTNTNEVSDHVMVAREAYDQYDSNEDEEYDGISVFRLAIGVDQIDGHDKISRHDSVESYKVTNKPYRAVSFRAQLVTSVYEFERCKPEDKKKLYYTSKDMHNFRIRYLWELQELRKKKKLKAALKDATIAALIEDASSSFAEFISCSTGINLCPNKKSKT